MIDMENQYLHVVITSKMDDISHAKLQDVNRLNMTMASCARYFKTAFIQYQSRNNADLRNELIQIALSCQKNINEQTESIM